MNYELEGRKKKRTRSVFMYCYNICLKGLDKTRKTLRVGSAHSKLWSPKYEVGTRAVGSSRIEIVWPRVTLFLQSAPVHSRTVGCPNWSSYFYCYTHLFVAVWDFGERNSSIDALARCAHCSEQRQIIVFCPRLVIYCAQKRQKGDDDTVSRTWTILSTSLSIVIHLYRRKRKTGLIKGDNDVRGYLPKYRLHIWVLTAFSM